MACQFRLLFDFEFQRVGGGHLLPKLLISLRGKWFPMINFILILNFELDDSVVLVLMIWKFLFWLSEKSIIVLDIRQFICSRFTDGIYIFTVYCGGGRFNSFV